SLFGCCRLDEHRRARPRSATSHWIGDRRRLSPAPSALSLVLRRPARWAGQSFTRYSNGLFVESNAALHRIGVSRTPSRVDPASQRRSESHSWQMATPEIDFSPVEDR